MAINESVAMTQQPSPQQMAQPGQKQNMTVAPLTAAQQQQGFQEEQTPDGKPEHLNLRGGCPGKLCGLPILPCHCDCWIIPLPCC